MAPLNLDMDILRTLVAAKQLGAFNRAARQVGRSQSAISQQIHKFEERIGQALFEKQGRGLALTDAGEVILAYAQRILDLNDEAVAAVHGLSLDGAVRFGLPGDFAETWLPAVLGRFRRAHPTVRIEAMVDRSISLLERMEKGELDLCLTLGLDVRANSEVLATLPMTWIGGKEPIWRRGEPVPLALFEQPCIFRSAAVSALDAVGLPWRVTFTSPSLSGLWAAVDAGLGITLRTAASGPEHLTVYNERSGLPALPSVHLCLQDGGRRLSPAAARLQDIILETLPANIAAFNEPARRVPAA